MAEADTLFQEHKKIKACESMRKNLECPSEKLYAFFT